MAFYYLLSHNHQLPSMEHKYQTFWRRFFAGFIDGLIFLPVAVLPELIFDMSSSRHFIISEIVYFAFWAGYLAIGHGIYGYTIGKKLCKVKLLDKNEKDLIGVPRALLRESIWILFTVGLLIYLALQTWEKGYFTEEEITQYQNFQLISAAWVIIELVTMLSNNKRRAVHDFIAGSVVVKAEYVSPLPDDFLAGEEPAPSHL